jgi:DNA primase
MPGIDFEVLRNEIGIDQVLDVLGFQPSSVSGDQLRGPCPVHGSSSDQSRSFSVNVMRGRYYCFKCNSKGNQLELWAAVHRISIYQAAADLCKAIGRDVPWIYRW